MLVFACMIWDSVGYVWWFCLSVVSYSCVICLVACVLFCCGSLGLSLLLGL